MRPSELAVKIEKNKRQYGSLSAENDLKYPYFKTILFEMYMGENIQIP